ncbi:hypothetical protein OIU85_000041 [Salix viminalis]|uniref:Uncharacterized protein n=1 Tax=Salix viminalis TaxID=40686 RepID=A0A9Q0VKV5_SALVM|nr:hypothetical protein OIU85_000041 [Salix viminalis]
MKVVAASKGSKTLLLLVVIIGLMLTSAVAKGGGGFRGGRAAGTGGLIGGGTATTGGKTSASVTWGPTSTFWLLLTEQCIDLFVAEENIKENKLLTRSLLTILVKHIRLFLEMLGLLLCQSSRFTLTECLHVLLD